MLTRLRRALKRVGHRAARVTVPVTSSATDLARHLDPAWNTVRSWLSPVTGLGWTVVIAGVGTWFAGWKFGWLEFMYIAACCLILFVICALLSLGGMNLAVRIDVDPRRMAVGAPSAGRVEVGNSSRGLLFPLLLELPVGRAVARFELPTVGPGQTHEEVFVIPTTRRGVIPVGPATSVRGDPFGLVRRTVTWAEQVDVFVHPNTVPLESLGAGLLRDLEGQTTNDLSMSDLAFHTLREYQPGDDRRYIHWRSSAKVGSATQGGKFLIRQFLDTRRSHVALVVDSEGSAYTDPDLFEFAISVAASIGLRATVDETPTTVVAGDEVSETLPAYLMLDAFARAALGTRRLDDLTRVAVRSAPDASLAFLITGDVIDFVDLRRAATQFPPEARKVAIRVVPNSDVRVTQVPGLTVVTIAKLTDLGHLTSAVMQV